MNSEIVECIIKKSLYHCSVMAAINFYFEICDFGKEERSLCISSSFFQGLSYNRPSYKHVQVICKFA